MSLMYKRGNKRLQKGNRTTFEVLIASHWKTWEGQSVVMSYNYKSQMERGSVKEKIRIFTYTYNKSGEIVFKTSTVKALPSSL